MSEFSLGDLVANRTMSPGMAALLASAAEEGRSFLNVAVPTGAGKTTLMDAALEHRPAAAPVYSLGHRNGESLGIPEESAPPGLLYWAEISLHPVTDAYLWGEPVRRIFEAAHAGGHAVATSLHADGIESAFGVIAQNEVSDEHAARIDVVSYIRVTRSADQRTRRIAAMYEVDRVEGGVPAARLIHRWHEDRDEFEAVSEPQLVTSDAYQRHLAKLDATA